MPRNIQTPAPTFDPPPLAAPDPSAGRAIVIVLPATYPADQYAESAAAIAQHCANWPTPAPQLAALFAEAIRAWARAQQPE